MKGIIDFHAHIYPDGIAEKATAAIGEFYDFAMPFDGTAQSLLFEGKQAGITKFVVHSVATTPHQVRSVNRFLFAASDVNPDFIPFCTLHPAMSREQLQEEVAFALERNARGVKLHPDFQSFAVDGKEAYRIYDVVGKKLPVLLHTGDDRSDLSSPARMVRAAKDFVENTFVCAHFGSYRCHEQMPQYLGTENVYFDTSSSLAYLSVPQAKGLIRLFGADRFVFGTDFPMWRASEELARFKALGLTKTEMQKILYQNAADLLGI